MSVSSIAQGWLKMFREARSPNMFLSRFFTVKPGGIYNGKKVQIDIEREGEEVAVVIKESTGPNLNDVNIFTTKEFEPPSYGEAVPLDVNTLVERFAGSDPYSDARTSYGAKLIAYFIKAFKAIDNKIRRGIELQASQILQTGKLDLLDENGATRYELDFLAKVTHFPTVAVSWSNVASQKLQDLAALAKTIRGDSGINPDTLIFGESALRYFITDADVKEALDNRRMEVGEIAPRFVDSGATFYGFVWVGTYKFQMWAYPDTYTDPQTGLPVDYINADKVVMTSTRTRFDKVSARVPLPIAPDPRVSFLMPGRMSSRKEGFDVTPNVYVSSNGKQVTGELESKTLLVPVQIDGYGCLDTEV